MTSSLTGSSMLTQVRMYSEKMEIILCKDYMYTYSESANYNAFYVDS